MKKRSLLIAFSLLMNMLPITGFIMESVNTAFGMQRMLFG